MKHKRSEWSRQALVLLTAGLLLAGCSDGGDPPDTTQPLTISQGGTVSQGKVTGARVCADLNRNGICDPDEPFDFTGTDPGFEGTFKIEGIPAEADYVLLTEGGVDSLTGLPALPLQAPKGAANVTPLTTLVALAADPAQAQAIIDQMAGPAGYDVDLSRGEGVPAALLALAKSVESVLAEFAGLGLAEPAQQTAILSVIAGQLAAAPAGTPIETVLAAAAGAIAADPMGTVAAPNFAVADPAVFAAAVSSVVAGVAAEVNAARDPVTGLVVENTTLQTALVQNVPPADFSGAGVQSVVVKVARLDILAAGDTTLTTFNPPFNAPLAVSADYGKVTVNLAGSNGFTDARTFSGSFTLTVADINSGRRLAMTAPVAMTVGGSASPTVTLTTAPGSLKIEGRNSAGDTVVTTSKATFTNPALSGASIVFDIQALQAELAAQVGPISSRGTFDILCTVSSAPVQAAAVRLVVQ